MKTAFTLITGAAAVAEHHTHNAEVVTMDHAKLETELGDQIDRNMHHEHKTFMKQHRTDQAADPSQRYIPNLADCMRHGIHVNPSLFQDDDHITALMHPLHQRSKDTLEGYCPRAIRYAALDHAQHQAMVHFEAMRPIWAFPHSFAKSHIHFSAHQQAAALMEQKTNDRLRHLAQHRQWLHRANSDEVNELNIEKLISPEYFCTVFGATRILVSDTSVQNAMGTKTPIPVHYPQDEMRQALAGYYRLNNTFDCKDSWEAGANNTKAQAAQIVKTAFAENPGMWTQIIKEECNANCNADVRGTGNAWNQDTQIQCNLGDCLLAIRSNDTYQMMLNLGRLQASQAFRHKDDETHQNFLPWWVWLIIGLIIALFVGMICWAVMRKKPDEEEGEEGEGYTEEYAEAEGEGAEEPLYYDEGEEAGGEEYAAVS